MAAPHRCGAAVHVKWRTSCILTVIWAGLGVDALAGGDGSDSASVRVVVFGHRTGDGSLDEVQQWIFNTAMRSMYHDNWRRYPPALLDGLPSASDAPGGVDAPLDDGFFYGWEDTEQELWIQWEFYEPKLISQVLLSGNVTEFQLAFSRDGDEFDETRTFTVSDPQVDFAEVLDPPAVASVVRLIPLQWQLSLHLRATLLGYPHYQLSKDHLPRTAPRILPPFTSDQDGSISVLERAVFEFQITGVENCILDVFTRNLCTDYRYRNLDISFLRALDAAKSYPHQAFDIAARSGEGVKGLIHLSVTKGDATVCEPVKKGLLLPECPRNALRPRDRPTDTWSTEDSFEPWRCRCKWGYEAVFEDGTTGDLLLSGWVSGKAVFDSLQYVGKCVKKQGFCSLDPKFLGNAVGLVTGARERNFAPATGTLGEVAYVRCPDGFVPDDLQTHCIANGERGTWSPPVRCRYSRPREPLTPTCVDPVAGSETLFVRTGCTGCFAGEPDCRCQVGCAEGYKLMDKGRTASFLSVPLTCTAKSATCPEPSGLTWNPEIGSCADKAGGTVVSEWCCPGAWGRSKSWNLQRVDDCTALVTEVSCMGSLQSGDMTGCCWTSDEEWIGDFCVSHGPAVGDAEVCAVPFVVPVAVWSGELPDCRPLIQNPFVDLPNLDFSDGCYTCVEGEECDCHAHCAKGTILVGGQQGHFSNLQDVKLPVCMPVASPPDCKPVQREGLAVTALDPGFCKHEAPFLGHCYKVRCDTEWRVPGGGLEERVVQCFEVAEEQVRESMAADKKCEDIHWEQECVTSLDMESAAPCLWNSDGFSHDDFPFCVPNMSTLVTPDRLPEAYAPARESAVEPLPGCQPLCPNRLKQHEKVDVTEGCKDCFQGDDPNCLCQMTCKHGFEQVGGPPAGPRMCDEPSLKSGSLVFAAPPVCRANPSTRCRPPEIAFAVPSAGCASCSADNPEACDCGAQCIATHRVRVEEDGPASWKGTCIMKDQTHELRAVHNCEDISRETDCVGEAPLWRGSVDHNGNTCCWRAKGLWDGGPSCAAKGHEGMEFLPTKCAESTVPEWNERFPVCVELCQNQDVSRLAEKLDITLEGCDDCVCGDQDAGHTEKDTKIAGCTMKCRDGYEKVGIKDFPAPGAETCNAIASGKDSDLPLCLPRCENDLGSVIGLAAPPDSCSECVAGQECSCTVRCEETHLKVGSWSEARTCTVATLSLSKNDGTIFCKAKPPLPVCPSLDLPGVVVSEDTVCSGDEACLRRAKVSCNDATHLASNPSAQGDVECVQLENQALSSKTCTLVGNRKGCIGSQDADSKVPCCWHESGLLKVNEKCAPMWGAAKNFVRMPQECAPQFEASWGELPKCQPRCRQPKAESLVVLGVLLDNCAACVADEPCNCKASCDTGRGFQRVDSDEEEQQLSCTRSRLDFILPVCLSVPQPVCDTNMLTESTSLQIAGGQPEFACREHIGSTCKVECAPQYAISTAARFAPAAAGRSDGVKTVTCQSGPIKPPEDTCSRFHGSMKQCLQHNDEPSDGRSVPCCWLDGGGNACVPKGTESIALKGSVTACTAQFEGVWEPELPTCFPVCKNDIVKRHKFVRVVGCEDPIVEDDEDALCGVECVDGAIMTNYKCGLQGKPCPPVELVCRHGSLAPKRSKDKFPICLPPCPDIQQGAELKVTGCHRCWPGKPGCDCDVQCAQTGAVHVGNAAAAPGSRKCILSDDGTAKWDKPLPQCVAQCQPPPPNPFMDTSKCNTPCSANEADCMCEVSCKTRKPQITTLRCVVSDEGIPAWDGEMPACSSIGAYVVDGMTGQKLVGAILTLRDAKTGQPFGNEQQSNPAGEVIWHTKMTNFKISAALEGYFGQALEFEWARDCVSNEQSSAACVVTMALIRISELATGDKQKGQNGHFGEMDKRLCTMYGSRNGAYYVASAALNWRARAVDLDLWVRAQSGRSSGFTCGRKPGDRRKLDAKSVLVKHRYAKSGEGLCKVEQCCVLNPQLKRSVPPGQDCTGCVRDGKSTTGCRRLGVDKGSGQFCHKGCCDYLSSCLTGAEALKDVNPQMTSAECGMVHRNQYPTWISGKSGARLIHTLEEYKKWQPCAGDGSMCSLRLEADIMEGGGVPEFARMENLPPGIYQVVANIYRPDDSYEASNDILKAKPRVTLSLGIQELHKSPRKVDFECEISDDCRVAGATIWHVATIHVSEGKVYGSDAQSYRYSIRILDSGPSDPRCNGAEDIDNGCMPRLDAENFPTQNAKQSEERAKGAAGANWVEPDYFVPNYVGMYHQRQLLENVCYGKCRAAEGSTDFAACLYSSGVPRP